VQLSIVIPVYRSEKILPELVRLIELELKGSLSTFEIILVNDCSPDESGRVVEDLTQKYAFVRGLDLAINTGQHNAVMAGLKHASGEVIVLMDDDLQHSPKYILPLYEEIRAGFDICYSKFEKQQHPLWKRLGSAFTNLVSSYLLNKPKNLYLSSFKAISKFIRDEVVTYDGPYAYVDGLILSYSSNYKVIDVEHISRYSGEGGYNLKSSVSLWLKMTTSFSIAPLRLASLFGFSLSGVGFFYAIYIVIKNIFYEVAVEGWSSIIVVFLVTSGIQLVMLGVIGEYVGRAYLKLNGKPQFVIRNKYNFEVSDSLVAVSRAEKTNG